MGADVVVNTDGDGQYPGTGVPELIKPILEKKADLVVGDRQPGSLAYFPLYKRLLERLGSWVVRHASGTNVSDAPSGFRALSRDAALRLNVFGEFTYTLETLIQAGHKSLEVASIPIVPRRVERPSRLFRSLPEYLKLAGASIVRIYAMYRPMPVFVRIGGLFLLGALLLGVRFLWHYFQGHGSGMVQSLILAAILSILGIQTLLLALIADLIATNRKLSEDILLRLKKNALGCGRYNGQGRSPMPTAAASGPPSRIPSGPAAPGKNEPTDDPSGDAVGPGPVVEVRT